jgi:DNA (cytosine-5)-methyltransferase 1
LPPVDIICGGFPCQDISQAGKGAGLAGDRSGLYFEMLRVVCEMQPRLWVMENVSAITHRGLDVVLRTMAKAGYDARWGLLRASTLGAPQRRKRWFCVGWLANTDRSSCKWGADKQGWQAKRRIAFGGHGQKRCPDRGQSAKPGLGGIATGVSPWLDIVAPRWPAPVGPPHDWEPPRTHIKQPQDRERLKALGNAVVPAQAAVIGRWIAQELLQPV